MIIKKDYHNKNVLNLDKKHLVILEVYLQQFTIGMLNSIEEEITLKKNLVLVDQEVHSLQKTLKLSVS